MFKDIFSYKVDLPFKDEIIEEAIKQRDYKTEGFNFLLHTKYRADLYDIFISKCKELFKNIDILEEEFNVWCSVSLTNWHNHQDTANINGVIYLKLCSNEKGIDFKINDKVVNYIPCENELIIFPSYLWHLPNVSITDEKRISLNLELLTKQSTKDLFNEI